MGDAYFSIGGKHDICQDYALAGDDWAVVCDGCSSSPSSDFGARFMATAAARALAAGEMAPAMVLSRAKAMADAVGLPAASLDTTLCFLERNNATVGAAAHAHVLGDGVVAARRRDGRSESWHVRASGSAPAYLSYMLDDERLSRYLEAYGGRTVERYVGGQLVDVATHHLRDAPFGIHIELDVATYEMAMVVSDGAASFRHEGRAVPLPAVLHHLMRMKSYKGRFVTRRMRRFLRREADSYGWTHDDDIAAAGLSLS